MNRKKADNFLNDRDLPDDEKKRTAASTPIGVFTLNRKELVDTIGGQVIEVIEA